MYGKLTVVYAVGNTSATLAVTVHTSCFKLVLATQQAPSGTGRLALAPWGMAAARAERARTMAEVVNFIFAVALVCWRV
jgi:hypothetical protein